MEFFMEVGAVRDTTSVLAEDFSEIAANLYCSADADARMHAHLGMAKLAPLNPVQSGSAQLAVLRRQMGWHNSVGKSAGATPLADRLASLCRPTRCG